MDATNTRDIGDTASHRVAMIAYPGAQILDIAGPLEVFARTARWLRDHQAVSGDAYTVEILGLSAGPFTTSSGLELVAARGYRDVDPADLGTLLVTGGTGWEEAAEDVDLIRWLREAATRTGRFGSVCTGALILGRAGLLEGQQATTHWAYFDELRNSGAAGVRENAIFVRDRYYTSAGVTAGMDMSLAMVEEDRGSRVALAVARELVLYLKRPGGQSQYSIELQAQRAESDVVQSVLDFIAEHLGDDLAVGRLADQAAMSPRNFARRFVRETGVSPHKYVERVRVDAARRRLEDSNATAAAIAHRVGFGSAETMRRAFVRHLGLGPREYRARFARPVRRAG